VPLYRFANFSLSPRRRLLLRDGRELPLIPRYFDLLVFLIERRHEAVHRREIFDRVWNDVIVSDSALSQAIRTLRRALDDDPREPRFIRTVSRHGYQFVFTDVVEERSDTDGGVPRAPLAALVGRRLQQAAGSTPVQWASASVGSGIAGVLAGAAGGLLLTAAPGSMAPFAVVPVLAMIGGACGAIGGAGVGAGISVGEASTRSKRALAIIVGAALGGALVGAAVEWLGRWSLAALVGLTVEAGGGIEGLVIGAAAGAGYALVTSHSRLRAAALMAACCGLGAFALTISGRPLVGGTLHAIARQAQGSQISLTPLARLLGEPDFGPVTRTLLGTGEGAVFGLGLALGLTRRASSSTSHETVTAH
jgi:DNA-binding winged helix-turn-helix (wHTH) protein